MPKFPRAFGGRRKSSANVFEDVQAPVLGDSVSSFKVFERPDGAGKSFDGGLKLAKATGAHLYPNKPKTAQKEDNMFEGIVNVNRGSGASNTNTASTTDNSSRLSAASTAPSSTDTRHEEWKTPHDKPFSDIPIPPVPKSQSGFSLKATGRTLSWGRNKNPLPPPPNSKNEPTPPPPISKGSTPSPRAQDQFYPRNRAVTASSYASTATPPRLDESELGLNLGGDFGDMFGGLGKRRSAMLEAETNRSMSLSPDHSPSGPASRPQPSNRFNQPTHLTIDRNKPIEPSQYSWSSQHSRDGLMLSASPVPFAPRSQNTPSPPPVPQHSAPLRKEAGHPPQARRPPLTDSGLRRNSAYSGRRQSTIDLDTDEDAKLLRESLIASRRLNEPSSSSKVRESWALPSNTSYKVENERKTTWTSGSTENTPKEKKAESLVTEDSLFDNDIVETANLAQRLTERQISPQPPHNKVMTPAQFERYRQDQERLKMVGGKAKEDEDEDGEDEPYDDEEDEIEKNKEVAKQRRKQEAHMAVYRQQMMKVTGETPSSTVPSHSNGNSLRPGAYGARSTPNLNLGVPEDGEEEDEEVPLAILQAHGFPNKSKPPMRTTGSNPNLRAPSVVGGSLPVFARHLPEDPYYGAGLQNPMNRESMAFGGGSPSIHGGSSQALPPGGLVGVIAHEERSRAMRRGSPNSQGNFGPPQPNGFDGMGMPNMANMGPMGGINPMMMPPGDPAQMQMNQQMQQMQQFMQVQMQFMQMMSQGQGQQPNGMMPSPQPELQRPSSAYGAAQPRPQSSHHRAMTMIDPNSAPWMNRASAYTPSISGLGGYAPSIAPSERSNIGLPGRYRPVSHAPQADNRSRTSNMSMSGALQTWENKNSQPNVKTVPKKSGNASDEDDDEGWEQMRMAKEKKNSIWRKKKDTNGLKDILGFAQ